MKIQGPTVLLLTGAFLAATLLTLNAGVTTVRNVAAVGASTGGVTKPELNTPEAGAGEADDEQAPDPEASADEEPPSDEGAADDAAEQDDAEQDDAEQEEAEQEDAEQEDVEPQERPVPPAGELIAVAGSPQLDNNPDQWLSSATMVSSNPVSGDDTGVEAEWQALWDQDALYLRATVKDEQIVQPFVNNPGQLFRGDSVSLELGSDSSKLSNTDPLRAGDAHYMFGPRVGNGQISAVNPVKAGTFVNGKPVDGARGVRHRTADGYVMEIALDWNLIGVAPSTGRELAANLNVSDGSESGELLTMKSTNPRRDSTNQSRPGTWQTLTLRARS